MSTSRQGQGRTLAGLGRLGLSHAALDAAIRAELDDMVVLDAASVSNAVAGAIEANNAEIKRQLGVILGELEAFRPESGIPPE